MAGDGQSTGGGMVHGFETIKVHKLPDGRIVGHTGDLYSGAAFIDWLITERERPELEKEFEALILMPSGECYSINHRCQMIPQETPAVAGSGGAFALGAMLVGASPFTAVGVATQRDLYTGGLIRVETINE